jgi:hypothetical protein
MPSSLYNDVLEEHTASVSGLMIKTAGSSEMSLPENSNPSHHTKTSNFTQLV